MVVRRYQQLSTLSDSSQLQSQKIQFVQPFHTSNLVLMKKKMLLEQFGKMSHRLDNLTEKEEAVQVPLLTQVQNLFFVIMYYVNFCHSMKSKGTLYIGQK